MIPQPPLNCPKCGVALPVDSVREYTDGGVRTYWECKTCNLSIMDRGESAQEQE